MSSCDFSTKHSTAAAPALALVTLLVIAQLLLLIPAQVFFSNGGEFSHGFFNILLAAPGGVWLGAIAALLISRYCLGGAAPLLFVLMAAFSIGIYAQSQLLLWDYGQFDGTPIPWAEHAQRALVDGTAWCVILLATVLLRRRLLLHFRQLCALLFLLHLVASLPALMSNTGALFKESPSAKLRSITEFSREKNVVLIVLDAMQGPAFQALIEQDSELRAQFKDFIFFRNATSSFPSTLPSVPAFLTGTAYDGSQPLRTYFEETVRKNSLPAQLEMRGVSSRIATIPGFCPYFDSGVCGETRRYPLAGKPDGASREFLELIDYTLFRIGPQMLKQRIYHDEQWFLQRLERDSRNASRSVDDGVAFARDFSAQASVVDTPPSFKMLHFLFPHPPIRLDADCNLLSRNDKVKPETYLRQSRCALKVALSLVSRLRELDIYRQSMIIIAADHGTRLDFGTNNQAELKERKLTQISRALPLVLIKPFGNEAELAVSNAQVALVDIARTIAESLNVPAAFPGENMLSLSPSVQRERLFRDFSFRWAKWSEVGVNDEFANVPTYAIHGDAWRPDSWTRVR